MSANVDRVLALPGLLATVCPQLLRYFKQMSDAVKTIVQAAIGAVVTAVIGLGLKKCCDWVARKQQDREAASANLSARLSRQDQEFVYVQVKNDGPAIATNIRVYLGNVLLHNPMGQLNGGISIVGLGASAKTEVRARRSEFPVVPDEIEIRWFDKSRSRRSRRFRRDESGKWISVDR